MPARSPAGRNTDWSTLKPLCGQVRMVSTISGWILSSASGAPGTPGRGEHGLLPDGQQPLQVQFGQFQKLALRRECPAGDQGMDVRVKPHVVKGGSGHGTGGAYAIEPHVAEEVFDALVCDGQILH